MNEFFLAINNFLLMIGGWLFDWLLVLGRDGALIVVALATSAILTFVRPFTTSQELLGRCDEDKKRLTDLIKQAKLRRAMAKAAGDAEEARRRKDELARYRLTVGRVGMKLAGAEGKPLLFAIGPLVLVFVWAADRLAYVPPAEGQKVVLTAYFPVSAVGQVAFIEPQKGLTAENGVMQRIHRQQVPEGQEPNGEANWILTAKARPQEPYRIQIQYNKKLYTKELLVGARLNSPVLDLYGEDELMMAELKLEPVKLFGVIHIPDPSVLPGWLSASVPVLYGLLWCLSWVPAWLAGYLLITIPFVFILKGVFHIF